MLLCEKWLENARTIGHLEAIVHYESDKPAFRYSWLNLWNAAVLFAREMKTRGIRPGDICALILGHHRLFYPVYMGIMCLGAVPSVLAYPNPRIHPEKFKQGLEGMAKTSGLRWLFTEREIEPLVKSLAYSKDTTIEGSFFPFEWKNQPETLSEACFEFPLAAISPDEPCLL